LISNNKQIHCDWRELPRHVRLNDVIYIDNGKIVLLVTDIDEVNSRSYILAFRMA